MLEHVVGEDRLELVVVQAERAEARALQRRAKGVGTGDVEHRVGTEGGVEVDVEAVGAPVFAAAEVEVGR